MSKALLIAAIAIVILLVAILMWPGAGTHGRTNGVAQAGAQLSPTVAHAEPYATSEEFYAAWIAYLRGGSSDTARIIETASRHRDWVKSIFSINISDLYDGLRLAMGKYRILYPYMSGEMIDKYGILLIEVSNNKPDIVNSLIKYGANPNNGLILTSAQSPQMIDALIRGGADPNTPRIDGSSPLEYFKHLGRPDLIDAMIRNGAR
jgi:hypothetical protein